MENQFAQLLSYWQILLRHRKLFLLVAVAITALAVAGIYSWPRKYRADSTVFIESSVINALIQGLAVTPEASDRIRVLQFAMVSRSLLEKVVRKLDPELLPQEGFNEQQFISDLIARTSVSVRREDLFTVSMVDANPRFARDYVNLLVNTYLEENLSLTRDEAYGANRFLDEQVALFKQKLDRAEDVIIDFRRQQGIYATADEGAVLAEIKRFKDELEQVTIDIGSMQARQQQVLKELAKVPAQVSIFNERQTTRAEAIVARLRQLMAVYTDDYPEIIRLRAELAALKAQRSAAPGETVSSMSTVNPVYTDLSQRKMEIESELGALKDRQSRLQRLVESRERDLREIPENQKQLMMLVQERDSLRQVYEQLLARVGRAEVSKQMEIGNKATTFRVVDPALLPQRPISPNVLQLLLLAVAAGLAGAYGLIFLVDQMDPLIWSLAELEEIGVPVIGTIPNIPGDVEPQPTGLVDRLVYSGAACFYVAVLALWGFELLK